MGTKPKTLVKTTAECCERSTRRPWVVFSFILSLALYGSAFVHFQTSVECDKHQNLVQNDSRYDFKSYISWLSLFMQILAYVNIAQVILNAILLLFWSRSSSWIPYVLGVLLSSMGVFVTIIGAVSVIMVGKNWNENHNSSNSFYYLHKTLLVGDISKVQNSFRLQCMLGFLLFVPVAIYMLIFWGRLLYLSCKKKGTVMTEKDQKDAENEVKNPVQIRNQDDSRDADITINDNPGFQQVPNLTRVIEPESV